MSPPFCESRPQYLHRFLVEVQIFSHHNVLCDRIMPCQYACLHLLKTCLLHCRLQRWVLPTTIQQPLGLPLSDTYGYPIFKPPRDYHVRGVISHVSDPKKITACTPPLNNIPYTIGFSPSLPKILDKRSQLFLAFRRSPSTASQLSSDSVIIQPSYLKDITQFSGLLKAWKALAMLVIIYSAIRRCRFRSAPLPHWSVVVWKPFRSFHGTRISQRGHCVWVGFPPQL